MPPLHRNADTSVSPPVQTAGTLLPFSRLSWEKFEELCLELVRSQPDVDTAKQYGCPGQAQHGIDLYARKRNGRYECWQVKRRERYKAAELSADVAAFMAGKWLAASDRFLIALQCSTRDTSLQDEIERQVVVLRAHGVAFEVLGAEELSTALRAEESIVGRYFGSAWAAYMLPAHHSERVTTENAPQAAADSARALLSGKAAAFAQLRLPLSHKELRYLFAQRKHIDAGSRELSLILASMWKCWLDGIYHPHLPTLGWYWFRNFSTSDWFAYLTFLGQLDACAARLMDQLPRKGLEEEWRRLLTVRAPALRAAAVRALPAFPREQSLPMLHSLLNDQAPEVQREAALALAQLSGTEPDSAAAGGPPAATRALLPADATLPSLVRELNGDAARLLAERGNLDDLPLLLQFVEHIFDEEEFAHDSFHDYHGERRAHRDYVLAALMRTAQRTPEVLRALTRNRLDCVRHAAAHTLASLQQVEDEPLFATLLRDHSFEVRAEAALVLSRAGAYDLERLLQRLFETTCDRKLATDTLRTLLQHYPRSQLEAFLDDHHEQLNEDALVALDQALYQPPWLHWSL